MTDQPVSYEDESTSGANPEGLLQVSSSCRVCFPFLKGMNSAPLVKPLPAALAGKAFL